MRAPRKSGGVGVAALFVAVLCAGCGADAPRARDITPPPSVMGRFVVDVMPPASGDGPVEFKVTRVDEPDAGEAGAARAALTSVLSSVSLFGPGAWNATTKKLTADIRVTNNTAQNFDEPQIKITWISKPTEVFFEQNHGGGSGVGAFYAYADIPLAGGVERASAHQIMVISDPTAVAFRFAFDVLANPGGMPIFPDRDNDRYNTEIGQFAGDDCNDADITKNPAAGACTCPNVCDATCGMGAGCCTQSCSGNCSPSCVAGCSCSFVSNSGSNNQIDCVPTANCSLTCNNPATCSITNCLNSSCDQACTGGNTCRIRGCDASTCELTCDRTKRCEIESCTNGSTCVIDCDRATTNCALNCTSGAYCLMKCNPTSGSCNLTCPAGQTIVTCGGGIRVCSATPCP